LVQFKVFKTHCSIVNRKNYNGINYVNDSFNSDLDHYNTSKLNIINNITSFLVVGYFGIILI